jgi:hypothetical protein
MRVARHQLTSNGVFLMDSAEVNARLGADRRTWHAFSRHWDELEVDRYAAELGTRRLRRYGHFMFAPADGAIRLMPHDAFVQPDDSNPLYLQHERHFEPLTDAFVEASLVQGLLRLLAQLASALDDPPQWSVKVTPFRVLASADDKGNPNPEGVHRDGVTLVSSLLIGLENAAGGRSSVFDGDGHRLLSTTLTEPGTLLLGDDRRTLHGVSLLRPRDPTRAARRDVLVITFASAGGWRRRRTSGCGAR